MPQSRNGRVVVAAKRVVSGGAFLFLLTMATSYGACRNARADAAVPPTVRLQVSMSSASVGAERGFVAIVLDRSGSMIDESSKVNGLTSWQQALEDIRNVKVPAALKAAGDAGIEIGIFPFSSGVADFTRPAGNRLEVIESEAELVKLDAIFRRVPLPAGTTRLYDSVASIARSLASDGVLDRFGWVYFLIYSDGDDDSRLDAIRANATLSDKNREQEKRTAMCAALKPLMGETKVVVDYLPIGNLEDLSRDCGGLRRTELGRAAAPPVVASMTVTPTTVSLAKVTQESRQEVQVDLELPQGFDPNSMQFEISDRTVGAEIVSSKMDGSHCVVAIAFNKRLEDGARIPVSVSIADSTSVGRRLKAMFTCTVPGLQKLPKPSAWGLPRGCTDSDGTLLQVGLVGQETVLSVNVPDAKVTWSGAPSGPSEGSDFRTKLPVGAHDLTVEVAADGMVERTALRVIVLDPTLAMVVPPKPPIAGDPFECDVVVPDWIPAGIRDKILGSGAAWFLNGLRREGATLNGAKGRAVLSSDEAGQCPVEFSALIEVCGQPIRFHSTERVDVLPGPVIQILTGQFTRDCDGEVQLRVMQRDQVARVVVWLGDGSRKDATLGAKDVNGESEGTVLFSAGEIASRLKTDGGIDRAVIHAQPILSGDSGVALAPDDRKNTDRAREQVAQIVEPDITVVFETAPGEEIAIGASASMRVRVSGADSKLIDDVELFVVSGSGIPTSVAKMARTESDQRGVRWESKEFRPTKDMPSKVTLDAIARLGGKEIRRASTVIHPTRPKPRLVRTDVAVGSKEGAAIVRWGGGPEWVPVVQVELHQSETSEPYPEDMVAEVVWEHSANLTPVESNTQGESRLPPRFSRAFRPIGAGVGWVQAKVAASKVEQTSSLARMEFSIAPNLFGVDPPSFTLHCGSDVISHGSNTMYGDGTLAIAWPFADDSSGGAYSKRDIQLKVGDADWIDCQSDLLIPFPGAIESNTPCEVRVTWSPFGENTTQVRYSAPFTAGPDRSRVLLAVLGIAAVALLWVTVRLGFGNSRLGQGLDWSIDEAGQEDKWTGTVGVTGEARLSLWTKAVTTNIPTHWIDEGEGSYQWLCTRAERSGGRIRLVIDKHDNLLGEGQSPPPCQTIDGGLAGAGYRFLAPSPIVGRPTGLPFYLLFDTSTGAWQRAFVGFLAVVGIGGIVATVIYIYQIRLV